MVASFCRIRASQVGKGLRLRLEAAGAPDEGETEVWIVEERTTSDRPSAEILETLDSLHLSPDETRWLYANLAELIARWDGKRCPGCKKLVVDCDGTRRACVEFRGAERRLARLVAMLGEG